MKPLNMGLCALVSFFSLQTFAQTYVMPDVWECSADCFDLAGQDGATLNYIGKQTSDVYYNREDAMSDLQEQCGNGLLAIRKLQGTLSYAQRRKIDETTMRSSANSETHYHGSYYYYYNGRYYSYYPEPHSSSSSSSTTTHQTYQTIDHSTRAIFQFLEATPGNSCKKKSLYQDGIYTDSRGNQVRG